MKKVCIAFLAAVLAVPAFGGFMSVETISTPSVNLVGTPPGTIVIYINGATPGTFTANAESSEGHALEYQYTWGDGTTGSWGDATQTHVYIFTGPATYNLQVQARCADHPTVLSPISPVYSVIGECLKSAAFCYMDWITWGRPSCWCFKKHCRGDINGTMFMGKPVTTADLNIFKQAYNVKDVVLATIPDGICADFNHSGFLDRRVTTADLNILKQYYNVPDSSIPVCPAEDFNFWTN